MTTIDVQKSRETRTLTVTARFDAPPDRVWQVWADPRRLERWWGPPAYPATVVDHDLRPGGVVSYFMTGPEGDKHHGWWQVRSVDEGRGLVFEDGFADDAGNPDPGMPTMTVSVSLEPDGDAGTRMSVVTTFGSIETMEQLEAMGMVEGTVEAMGQIPALLEDSAAR
jgi:uncharacterized protein YndB with AHSA1/START domain